MIYRIDMDGETRTLISHMAPLRKQKIRESLRTIAENPLEGKPLQENLLGLYSYRVGTFRIIYALNKAKKVVHLVTIGPRRNVYEELERTLRRRD